MHEIDQILPTSRSLRKGWIGCENFDREVDFVDDSLAGSVATVEQFEVFDSVVSASGETCFPKKRSITSTASAVD
jgi:hypothetical protein